MTKNQGFTLLELIVVMAVAGVLCAFALPAFNNTIAESRMTSVTNGLVGALNLARSEAIEANASVIVEASPQGGWQLRNLNTGAILKTFTPAAGDVTVTASSPSVTFQANGYRLFNEPLVTLDVASSSLSKCRRITIATGGSTSTGNCP